jgi:hypothetical protein
MRGTKRALLSALFAVGCTRLAGVADFDEIDLPDAAVAPSPEAGGAPDAGHPTEEIAFVSATSASLDDAGAVTLSLDLAPAEGDLLWLVVYTDHAATAVTATGWTLQADRANASHDFHSWWYYRLAHAGDPTSYTLTMSAPTLAAAAVAVYRGVDPGAPFDGYATGDTQGNPYVSPSLSTARGSARIVASFTLDHADAAAWNDVPGAITRAKQGQVLIADFAAPSPGTIAPVSATSSVDDEGAADLIALSPAR